MAEVKEKGSSYKTEVYSTTKRSHRIKILSYGETKCGKTRFIRTLPKPFVIDSDGSGTSLREYAIPYTRFSRMDVIDGKLNAFETTMEIIDDARNRRGIFKDIESLCFDGITTLSQLFIYELMFDVRVGKTKRDPLITKPTWDEYGPLGERLNTIFTAIDDLDMNIYTTAGLKFEKDDVSGRLVGIPDIVGSFRDRIGSRFDCVFYMEQLKGKCTAYTVAQSKCNAGVRELLDAEIPDPDFVKIFGKRIEAIKALEEQK